MVYVIRVRAFDTRIIKRTEIHTGSAALVVVTLFTICNTTRLVSENDHLENDFLTQFLIQDNRQQVELPAEEADGLLSQYSCSAKV